MRKLTLMVAALFALASAPAFAQTGGAAATPEPATPAPAAGAAASGSSSDTATTTTTTKKTKKTKASKKHHKKGMDHGAADAGM